MRMTYLRHSLIGTFLAVAALATPGIAFASSSPSSSQSPSAASVTRASKQVVAAAVSHLLTLINTDRATHHLAPLTLDASQSACSKKHSLHMGQLKSLTHDQFPADICTAYHWIGENVGEADGDPVAAVTLIHRMMMDEGPCPHTSCPGTEFETHGHFVNIVDKHFTKLGIGLVVKDGVTWVTENFTG
jgi:uncharacterized protein YkwD